MLDFPKDTEKSTYGIIQLVVLQIIKSSIRAHTYSYIDQNVSQLIHALKPYTIMFLHVHPYVHLLPYTFYTAQHLFNAKKKKSRQSVSPINR